MPEGYCESLKTAPSIVTDAPHVMGKPISFIGMVTCFVLTFGCSHAPVKRDQAFDQLKELSFRFEEYRRQHGVYPVSIDILASETKMASPNFFWDKSDYQLKLVHSGKDDYHVVTENNMGLRDFEIKNHYRYPMWIFIDDKDRASSKKILLDQISAGRFERLTDLRYFPDADTKKQLVSIAKKGDGNQKSALTILSQMITNEDQYLLDDLFELAQMYAQKEHDDELVGVISKLLATVIAEIGYYENDWDEIEKAVLAECKGGMVEIEHFDAGNFLEAKNNIVTAYYLSEKGDAILELIEKYVETQYDPVLVSLFLSEILYNDRHFSVYNARNKLLPLLMQFYENEKDNSIPCYYLSYYYLLENDLERSEKFLKEGYKRGLFSFYLKEHRGIIYQTVFDHTRNELCAYIHASLLFSLDNNRILYGIARRYDDIKNHSLGLELVALGKRMEENGHTLIEKLVGINIQCMGMAQTENKELISKLKLKGKSLSQLTEKLDKRNGRDALSQYLKNVYQYGEVYALENLR